MFPNIKDANDGQEYSNATLQNITQDKNGDYLMNIRVSFAKKTKETIENNYTDDVRKSEKEGQAPKKLGTEQSKNKTVYEREGQESFHVIRIPKGSINELSTTIPQEILDAIPKKNVEEEGNSNNKEKTVIKGTSSVTGGSVR